MNMVRLSGGNRPRTVPAEISLAAGDDRRFLPLKLTVGWLGGSYLLFLVTPYRESAQDVERLTGFIAATIGAFVLGYLLGIWRSRRYPAIEDETPRASSGVRTVIVFGALWFVLFGVASLQQFGATGLSDIVNAALHPGDGYRAKFDVFDQLQSSGTGSLPLQLTSWSGVLFAILVPFSVYYWRSLRGGMRTLVIFSLVPYLASFVYIGTMKGIGDLGIIAAASFAGCYGLRPKRRDDIGSTDLTGRITSPLVPPNSVSYWKNRPRALKYWLVAGGIILVGVMSNLLGGRAVNISQTPTIPVISDLFGDRFAAGLMTIWIYPTNGYTGLSQVLNIPFVFSGGASMPVFAQILGKFSGTPDPMLLSYPVRNEAINGWSATMTWSTAYAWVASDLTFLGTIAAMAVLGWMVAHFWMGARRGRDPLSLSIFSLLAYVVAYLPANNQIFLTRYTATGLITLLIVYALRRLFRPRRSMGLRPSRPLQSKGSR